MSNTGKVRHAHEIINDMADGYIPDHDDLETLRSFLPDLPAQKTLEELRQEVYDAWIGADCNEWPEDAYGVLETWLWNLHKQLDGLASIDSKPSQASPKLPEGMRLANHRRNGLCVVSPGTDDDGDYKIFYLSSYMRAGADSRWVSSDTLTFLEEETPRPESLEEETPHSEFLETEADYHHAPTGTIVAYKQSIPWIKWGGTWRTLMSEEETSAAEMSTLRRSLIRWGYGNE